MKTKIALVTAVILFCAGVQLFSQTAVPAGQDALQQAMTEFQKAQYDSALHDFRAIILNPSDSAVQGDAYFWIALSYLALGQLDDASKNLEFFLMNYKDNANVPEATYQKGRLLYLQGEYDKAIQGLYAFVQSYKDNAFTANAYYWIGESLYSLGHFDDAKRVFAIVIQQYPTSFKVEAARYRVSLIDLKNREGELLKLLKWSHEEALADQEDFAQRESAYEQALIAYQHKLADMAQAQQAAAAAAPASQASQDQIATLNNEVAQLQEQIKTLIGQLASPSQTTAKTPDLVSQPQAGQQTQELLTIKSEALDLKAYYLDWLTKHPGGGK